MNKLEAAKAALERFDAASRAYGWEEQQGSTPPLESEPEYRAAKAELLAAIEALAG